MCAMSYIYVCVGVFSVHIIAFAFMIESILFVLFFIVKDAETQCANLCIAPVFS